MRPHTGYRGVCGVAAGQAEGLCAGGRIEVLPSHGDTTINMHTHYFAMRDGKLEAVWEISGARRFR